MNLDWRGCCPCFAENIVSGNDDKKEDVLNIKEKLLLFVVKKERERERERKKEETILVLYILFARRRLLLAIVQL